MTENALAVIGEEFATVGIVVAHPDDETLWAGGLLLLHPEWRSSIAVLCRASDPDRSSRFYRALSHLRSSGRMADLDDGPDQSPLDIETTRRTVLSIMDGAEFDLLITHSPFGEYTSHLRHVETARAVINLWQTGRLYARQLWCFAYKDENGSRLPRAISEAHARLALPADTWNGKYRIIRDIYGFAAESWEARTTPKVEAFWRFSSPEELAQWKARNEEHGESISAL